MKISVAICLLIIVSFTISGCGETISGVGKDVNRMGRGINTFFFRDKT